MAELYIVRPVGLSNKSNQKMMRIKGIFKMIGNHSTLRQQALRGTSATAMVKTRNYIGAVFLFFIGIVMPKFGCQITKPIFEVGRPRAVGPGAFLSCARFETLTLL